MSLILYISAIFSTLAVWVASVFVIEKTRWWDNEDAFIIVAIISSLFVWLTVFAVVFRGA